MKVSLAKAVTGGSKCYVERHRTLLAAPIILNDM